MKNLFAIGFCLILITILIQGCNSSEKHWAKAKQLNTIESFNEYLLKHSKTIFADSARKYIEILIWEKTLNGGTLEAYQKFLIEYPQSKFVISAKEKIEEIKIQERINQLENELNSIIKRNPNDYRAIVPKIEDSIIQERKVQGLRKFLIPQVKIAVSPPFSGMIDIFPQRIDENFAYIDLGSTRYASLMGGADFSPFLMDYMEKENKKFKGILSIVKEKNKVNVILEYNGDMMLPFIYNSSGGISLAIYGVGKKSTDITKLFLPSADGSIYRFNGTVELFGCTFKGEGDETHRLTFLINEEGFVYIRGNGKVILQDSTLINFGYSE